MSGRARKQAHRPEQIVARLRQPERAIHLWAYDLVEDPTRDGRKFGVLCVVDESTREALAIRVARRLNASGVTDVLADLVLAHGARKSHPDHSMGAGHWRRHPSLSNATFMQSA